MQVVPFHVEHLDALSVDTTHNDDARPFLAEHPEAMEKLAERAWSMEHDGEIVACGGSVYANDRHVWWIALSPAARSCPLSLTRAVKRHVDAQCATGLHYAHAKDDTAGRWLEALGFSHVGYERGYRLYRRGAH